MRFILGPLIILLGYGMMRYTVEITNFTGNVGFAEKYFSNGLGAGTYTWWRLVGLCFMILAALWMFGMLDLVGGILRSFLGMNK